MPVKVLSVMFSTPVKFTVSEAARNGIAAEINVSFPAVPVDNEQVNAARAGIIHVDRVSAATDEINFVGVAASLPSSSSGVVPGPAIDRDVFALAPP